MMLQPANADDFVIEPCTVKPLALKDRRIQDLALDLVIDLQALRNHLGIGEYCLCLPQSRIIDTMQGITNVPMLWHRPGNHDTGYPKDRRRREYGG